MTLNLNIIIEKAKKGIDNYLDLAFQNDKIDKQSYDMAKVNTIENIKKWLSSEKIDIISPNLKAGIIEAIEKEEWEDIVNAFRKDMSFGTGGIRGLMSNKKEAIIKLKEEGLDAQVLKGPNTLNNIRLLLTSLGVAKFGQKEGFNKIVIGYDSRINGFEFSKIIAELFLAYDFTVYLFDEPCPYPEVTFAIPYEDIKAHIGILISASHNDYRYNGYKLSCGNGSQFDPEQRAKMYNDFIAKATFDDIKLLSLKDAAKGKVIFLGGDKPLENFDYYGHKDSLLDIHKAHQEQVKRFLLQNQTKERILNIGYCAFHGAGRIAVPRILDDIGFTKGINTKIITKNNLNELDGLFPSFNSEAGMEQQPDPGDPRAAKIAVETFKEEYPNDWEKTDIIIGTDPDADRCGVIVKVPEEQRFLYNNNDYMLVPADDMWALVLWYRLKFDKNIKPEETFIVLSHTTTDSIIRLCCKNGIGVIKTWVGFGSLSAGVRMTWKNEIGKFLDLKEGKRTLKDILCDTFIVETFGMEDIKRSYNLGSMEQSNGFSILGSPPKDEFSLGVNGHVRDKDGTFAGILIAEIAEWAKQNGTSIFELIDKEIYLDKDIGLFINYYEPDPLDGEYPGIEGDKIKKAILRRVIGLSQFALAGDLEIAGLPVKTAVIYRTGKYDHLYPKTMDFQFPDEGIRFYFDYEKVDYLDTKKRLNYITVRPSGTTNSLRFHIQLHSFVDEGNLITKKEKLHKKAREIADHIRELIKAPRSSELL